MICAKSHRNCCSGININFKFILCFSTYATMSLIFSLTYTDTYTHTHYTTMCPNHTQKYICTHTHLPLIRTHTLQYSMSDSHKHTHCISVGFIHTHTHIYTALLPHTHTHVHVHYTILCLFKCTHAPIYTQIYTMLFDSYTQLIHASFCFASSA